MHTNVQARSFRPSGAEAAQLPPPPPRGARGPLPPPQLLPGRCGRGDAFGVLHGRGEQNPRPGAGRGWGLRGRAPPAAPGKNLPRPPREPHGKGPREERGGGQAGEVGRDLVPLLKYSEIDQCCGSLGFASFLGAAAERSVGAGGGGGGGRDRPWGRSPEAGGKIWGPGPACLGVVPLQPELDKGEFSSKRSRATCGEGKVVVVVVVVPGGFSPRCFHHTDACAHPSACGGEGGRSPIPYPPPTRPKLPLPNNGDEEAKSPTCA